MARLRKGDIVRIKETGKEGPIGKVWQGRPYPFYVDVDPNSEHYAGPFGADELELVTKRGDVKG